MFFVITNIYNKKTKGPTLMELFTATGKLKKSGCGCVGHGRGFYLNTSALATNIFFGV